MSLDPDEFAAIYRREVGRCTATLVRVLGDIDQAEDAVAEAFAVVVALNRAIAVLEHRGPAAALDALDEIDLPNYHLFHATRAEALRRAGRDDEAADALRRAIALTSNAVERRHLERELAGLG